MPAKRWASRICSGGLRVFFHGGVSVGGGGKTQNKRTTYDPFWKQRTHNKEAGEGLSLSWWGGRIRERTRVLTTRKSEEKGPDKKKTTLRKRQEKLTEDEKMVLYNSGALCLVTAYDVLLLLDGKVFVGGREGGVTVPKTGPPA